ncbi:MAG: hypothetical protein ABI353_23685 [Isosphaeraceae bacterium]
MKRRRTWLALTVACASWATLAGCETIGHGLRSKTEPPIVVLDDPAAKRGQEQSDELRTGRPAGFFKANRRSGAWSSQAAEIEQSLGVPR